MKSIVHAIQLQGHSDSEETVELSETFHDAATSLPEPVNTQETTEMQEMVTPQQQETLMQISAEAIHGMPGDTTLSVLVKVGGQQAVALIDTGSTNTFLDTEFIKRTKLPVEQTAAQKVLVAGGGELVSAGHVPDRNFTIQNTKFSHNCKLLPLKGYDMVLGANWLQAHSPNYYELEN